MEVVSEKGVELVDGSELSKQLTISQAIGEIELDFLGANVRSFSERGRDRAYRKAQDIISSKQHMLKAFEKCKSQGEMDSDFADAQEKHRIAIVQFLIEVLT